MKKDIHPEYTLREIRCACGATYNVGGTTEMGRVEICSACHPFFTGKQKLLDTAGRVEKFKKRFAKYAESGSEK